MIINENFNLPVGALEINNIQLALDSFRTYKGNSTISAEAFIEFLSVPGKDRDGFLAMFQRTASLMNDTYVRQICQFQ